MKKKRSCSSSFQQDFQYISNIRRQITYSFMKCGCSIIFFLLESLGLRDNESRLYIYMCVIAPKIVDIFFSNFSQKTCFRYSLEVRRLDTSKEYTQHMFSWRNKKVIYLSSLTEQCMFVWFVILLSTWKGGFWYAYGVFYSEYICVFSICFGVNCLQTQKIP